MISRMKTPAALACSCVAGLIACSGGSGGGTAATGSGDSAFKSLATEIIQDNYKRHPSAATLLGVHTYDDKLEDYTAAAFEAEAKADSAFKARLARRRHDEAVARAAARPSAADSRDGCRGAHAIA